MQFLSSHYIGTGVFVRTELSGVDKGTGSLTVGYIGQGVWLASPFARGQRETPKQARMPLRRRLELDWIGSGVYARRTRDGQSLSRHFIGTGIWALRNGRVRFQTEKEVVCAVRGLVAEAAREIVAGTRAEAGAERPVVCQVRSMTANEREIELSVRGLTGRELEVWTGVRSQAGQDRAVVVQVQALVVTEWVVSAAVRALVSAERSILCRVRAGEPLAYLITGTGQATKVAMANGASSVQVQDGRAEPQTGETQATAAMKDGQTTAQII